MKKNFFDHEKLDVYQLALEFVVSVSHIVKGLPTGKAYLADQLKRASSSIPLNIAEGAGEYSGNEKVRFYRMAKRSATECASDTHRELKNWSFAEASAWMLVLSKQSPIQEIGVMQRGLKGEMLAKGKTNF